MDTRPQRTWFSKDDGQTKSRIILSHAPLTLGHSQLIMKFSSDIKQFTESERFGKAAEIIQKSISVFEQVFGSKEVHMRSSEFKKLSEITKTNGKYIKTLVLRTSAEEDHTEYKIHLLPYF